MIDLFFMTSPLMNLGRHDLKPLIRKR
jgi:hypothetical protein